MRLGQLFPVRFMHAMSRHVQGSQNASTKLSTGKDIKNPSDYLRASRAESDMRERQVIQRNLSDERDKLSTKMAVLETGQAMGLRLKELATQLENKTLADDEKLAIFKEASYLKDDMVKMFEEATFNTKPLFNTHEQKTVFDVDSFSSTSIHEVMLPESTASVGDSDRINNTVTKPYNLAIQAYQTQQTVSDTQATNETSGTTASTETSRDISFAEQFVADLSYQAIKDTAETYGYQDVTDYVSTKQPQDLYDTLTSYTFDELETLAVDNGYSEGFESLTNQGVFSLMGLEGAPALEEGDNYYESYTLIQQSYQDIDNSVDNSTHIDDDSVINVDTTINDNSDNNSHNTTVKDGVNIEIGDNNGDITINVNLPSDYQNITLEDMPDDLEGLLTPDAIDQYILDPIAKGMSDVGIKQNLIDFRSSLESRLEIQSQQHLSNIQDTDVAKAIADKQKHDMLTQINEFLFQDTLQKQGNIINLLA